MVLDTLLSALLIRLCRVLLLPPLLLLDLLLAVKELPDDWDDWEEVELDSVGVTFWPRACPRWPQHSVRHCSRNWRRLATSSTKMRKPCRELNSVNMYWKGRRASAMAK